jgi:gluconolactonase
MVFFSQHNLEKVFTGAVFSEGPAADDKGNVYFSDCSENIIFKFSEADMKTVIWDKDSGHANGMNFDHAGNLVTCCDGKKYDSSNKAGLHSVVRYGKDQSKQILVSDYNGKKLNGPNDLCFAENGDIFFTDPRYGYVDDLEQDLMGVYKIDDNLNIVRIIDDLEFPNGILISKDNSEMYIVDHNPNIGGKRTLEKYKLNSKQEWNWDQTLLDFEDNYGMDGMVQDQDGIIYVTGGEKEKAGVYAVTNSGEMLGFLHTPELPGNCTFGGDDLSTLYITATSSLYRVKTNSRGLLAFPR